MNSGFDRLPSPASINANVRLVQLVLRAEGRSPFAGGAIIEADATNQGQ
jgi:hypothetical protein